MADLTPALASRLERQLAQWRSELVPTDRRQNALYFRHLKSSSLEITGPTLAEIEQLVGAGAATFDVAPEAEDAVLYARARGAGRTLAVSGKTEVELDNALRGLDRKSREVFVDRGFWTLYLGLGLLEWVDPDDGRTVVSPLVLVPVQLKKQGTSSRPRLSRSDEDSLLNPVLALKMQDDFGISLEGFDSDAPDIAAVLAHVRAAVSSKPNWRVLERAIIATFSFHKEAMYRDLLDNGEAIAASQLVQLIALGPDAPHVSDFAISPLSDAELEEALPPESLVSILDADASQRRCILAARNGRSFVMDGPPGTGKSQTIANIIVELIATGRKVLFVSEKAAALDVVRKRLAEAELGDFLLELHSHNANRKTIAQDLSQSYDDRVARRGASRPTSGTLATTRVALTGFAQAMNEVRPVLGRNIIAVIGRLIQLPLASIGLDDRKNTADLSNDQLDEYLEKAADLARYWRPVTAGEGFPWRGLSANGGDYALANEMRTSALRASKDARAAVDVLRGVDSELKLHLPMTTGAAPRRTEIVGVLERRRSVPPAWLSMVSTAGIGARAAHLRELSERFGVVEKDLSARAGPAWADIDTDDSPVIAQAARVVATELGLPATVDTTWLTAAIDAASVDRHLIRMRELAGRLAAIFRVHDGSLTPAQARRLAELARLGASPERPEPAWLDHNAQARLDQSFVVIGRLVAAVRDREDSLRQTFTPAVLELDLSGLIVRFRDVHVGLRKWSRAARADKRVLAAVTVTGQVDQATLARLEEAATWQHAQWALREGEPHYAGDLGRFYAGTATNFARASSALNIAREALQLAGAEIPPAALSSQLSVHAQSDPQLVQLGAELLSIHEAWTRELQALFGHGIVNRLEHRTFAEVAEWLIALSGELTPALPAMERLSVIAQRSVSFADAELLITAAAVAVEITAEVFEAYDEDHALLGERHTGIDTDWAALAEDLQWAEQLRRAVGGRATPASASALLTSTLTVDDIRPSLEAWSQSSEALLGAFAPGRRDALRSELGVGLEDAATILGDMASSAHEDIADLIGHRLAVEWLASRGVRGVVRTMKQQNVDPAAIVGTVEAELLQGWLDNTVHSDTRLTQYRAADRDALVQRFRQLDRDLVANSKGRVRQACDATANIEGHIQALAAIRREAKKKTRHKSIKALLSETAELVQELKPCFMMSPLSVSQYLGGDVGFDVVIFDEASQILPSDAVNCVYRASQLIVAGDERQLPPTSFFTSADSESEDDDDSDDQLDIFESLLDLSKASGALPALPLNWHYRSQHEDLITYSNYRFYDGRLHTFPGATFSAPDLGVELYQANGVYRRGTSRDNIIEASVVVDRVLEHRRLHPSASLGVVTFSTAQEDAVYQELERRAAGEPLLAGLLGDEDRLDGFFIKSLENVQGDERDIIIFTIGYGPDEVGKLTANFGPINRKGGWRRLNVAITRARRRVEVISSFLPGQLGHSTNPSVNHLMNYLDFAQRGQAALAMDLSDSEGDAESPFEEDVASVVRGMGYDVRTQVGSAGYRIDLAVVSPTHPGSYVLAIECDGAAYHSAKVARDRDRLRAQVLQGLGWRIHRIWGLSWYRERAAQIEVLRCAIESAIAADAQRPVAAPLTAAVPPPAAVLSGVDTAVVEMQEAPLTDRESSEEVSNAPSSPGPAVAGRPGWATPYTTSSPMLRPLEGMDAFRARDEVRRFFQQVLAVEAPIHEQVALGRLAVAMSLPRLTASARSMASEALRRMTVDGEAVTHDQDGFYRIRGRTTPLVRVPHGDQGHRTVEEVPLDEVENAIERLVGEHGSIDISSVRAYLIALFAWDDVDAAEVALELALQTLTDEGQVELFEDRVHPVGAAPEV